MDINMNDTNKNILLITPCADQDQVQDMWLSPNIGVVRIAHFLNSRGHRTDWYDVNIERHLGKTSLEQKLNEKKWDIIGFSTLDDTLRNDLENMHIAHKVWPDALMIAGGLEAQSNYQTILDKSPCKIVVLGEGEIPLLMLANGEPLENISGIVVRNDAEILSSEMFAEVTQAIQWEALDYESYWDYYVQLYGDRFDDEVDTKIHTVRLFTKNRCPFKCHYCDAAQQLGRATGNLNFKGLPVVSLDIDHIMSTVQRVVESHPRVKTIYFTDDDFCFNKKFVKDFCRRAIALDLPVSYMAFARITDLTDEVIQLMVSAKFRNLNIGVESFSDKVLTEINKMCTADDVHNGIKMLARNELHAYFNIMLFTPKSTIDDVEETVDQTMKYISTGNFTAGIISSIIPLKGSPYFETTYDYMTEIEPVKGTEHLIKRHRYIYAEDPVVRELQTQYRGEIFDEISKYDIRHRETETLAMIQLKFIKRLIQEKRTEYELQRGTASEYYEGPMITGKSKIDYRDIPSTRPDVGAPIHQSK